jgi:16S rRNA (cytosine967-C5)-methyltransferase
VSRYHSYLNSAVQILEQYKGEEPFASFLKSFFKQHKKYGSKDRKEVSHLCYCYFRLGKAAMAIPVDERILAGLFFSSDEPNEILALLKPAWNEKIDFSLKEKLSFLSYHLSFVFPWKEELSNGIEYEKFNESFFIQPDLFLRLRPGYENIVKEKLSAAEIDFKEINSSCLALPNTSKVDDVIELDKEAVVQDHSSQRVGEFLSLGAGSQPLTAWDCCAGSGGKSLLLFDTFPDIKLTVSDIRESILINLKKRFNKAGIKKYNSFVTNLTQPNLKLQTSPAGVLRTNFEFVLCDAPCTGSGTWSRTPEELYYFEMKKIEEYASLQRKIVSNVIPQLSPGGDFLYITCSVFKKENEEIVEFIKQEFDLQVVKTELLKGYDKKADTMFAALLKKPL